MLHAKVQKKQHLSVCDEKNRSWRATCHACHVVFEMYWMVASWGWAKEKIIYNYIFILYIL